MKLLATRSRSTLLPLTTAVYVDRPSTNRPAIERNHRSDKVREEDSPFALQARSSDTLKFILAAYVRATCRQAHDFFLFWFSIFYSGLNLNIELFLYVFERFHCKKEIGTLLAIESLWQIVKLFRFLNYIFLLFFSFDTDWNSAIEFSRLFIISGYIS